ncbi:hypothetical protein GBN67_08175 [Acinetobacter johnsonii]|uniref:hypothetical protein n=1 Tax=Acinetobacter johnsonii TaxID=40214 RepID=UPI001F2F6B02|nr:hypothetical protein [Acinetobacter johnsonii]UIZ94917.1 hypothetical protein GBN67_08175 [Acinetobacter johnsonii]
MNNIDEIYNDIKVNNQDIDERIHILFQVLKETDFQDVTGGRFSLLFIMKLIKAMVSDDAVMRILGEIEILENKADQTSLTKPESDFKRGKIKGLWHKHYLPTGLKSISKNLEMQFEYKNKEIKSDINKILKGHLDDMEKSRAISSLVVTKQLSDRFKEKRITGEWIIYHVHNNQKYYLDIANHEDDEDVIAKSIRDIALKEFPEFQGSLPIFS